MIEEEAEKRAELISNVRPLLPDNYATQGKTIKDVLVAAVASEVEEPEKRSEDYLLAKVENIIERRSAVLTQPSTTTMSQASTQTHGVLNILDLARSKS